MLGAIIGDIIGSVYEFHNIKTKDFPLFSKESHFTDDTVCTIAVADALMHHKPVDKTLREWGRRYSSVGYGPMFLKWLQSDDMGPYRSFGNGAVMRLSPLARLCNDRTQAVLTGMDITAITHNSAEAITATEAYIETLFALKDGHSPDIIKSALSLRFGYDMNRTVSDIRSAYDKFYVRCSKSVPEAITCALDATSYTDAVRNAVSLGGDSDTLACMAGGLAAIRFPIPRDIQQRALTYLPTEMTDIISEYNHKTKTPIKITEQNRYCSLIAHPQQTRT